MMPAMLLGRMAVDDQYRGKKYGTILVEHAFAVCASLHEAAGFVALLVDAKTDRLVEYYEKHGFTRLLDRERGLFITVPTMIAILDRNRASNP